MSLLARKAAREELNEVEPKLSEVVEELKSTQRSIETLVLKIEHNAAKSVAPWRLWGLLIGMGSFLPWLALLIGLFLPQEPPGETAIAVLFGALLAAFLSGQLYRRLTIRRRRKAISDTDEHLQSQMESLRQRRQELKLEEQELEIQVSELKEIAKAKKSSTANT